MKKTIYYYLFTMLIPISICLGFMPLDHLITLDDKKTASLEAFEQMMSVITHKRCLNCHPTDDFPRQGEDSHKHLFDVQRGKNGDGFAVLNCGTCHQEENNNFSGVPGAPHWHLAPKSMGWQGLPKLEIAQSLLNRQKNGDRSPEDIVKHLTQDKLVLWAFEPGINHEGIPREKPPLTKENWIKAVNTWLENGAHIPTN